MGSEYIFQRNSRTELISAFLEVVVIFMTIKVILTWMVLGAAVSCWSFDEHKKCYNPTSSATLYTHHFLRQRLQKNLPQG